MASVNALLLPTASGVPSRRGAATIASSDAAFGDDAVAPAPTVQDVALPPRRRAQDAAEAPGFPAAPHLAHLLAQATVASASGIAMDGIATYQAAIRGRAEPGRAINLQA